MCQGDPLKKVQVRECVRDLLEEVQVWECVRGCGSVSGGSAVQEYVEVRECVRGLLAWTEKQHGLLVLSPSLLLTARGCREVTDREKTV